MKFSHRIKVETGLHGRMAAKIVNKCLEFKSDVSIVFNGKIGNTTSLMSLLNLGAKEGDVVNVIIDGEDECLAYYSLRVFLEENF